MKEELRVNENTVEEPEGLRLLLTQVGLKHIAETLQQLPQSTYEAITTLIRSALDRLSPKYQQVAWSLVLATALNACTGIEQASAQSKTVTPDQPGKPTVVTPTPTKEIQETPTTTPTATPYPEVTPTPMTVEVIDVAGGINRRKAPNGPIIDTTPGTAQEITTYKRSKAPPVKAGGYTWYEATDGDQTFWVALLEKKVTLRTEQVSIGTGGGGIEEKPTTLEEELSRAREELGRDDIKTIDTTNPMWRAVGLNNEIVAVLVNGVWQLTMEQESAGAVPPIQSEIMSQTMTFEEFRLQYSEIAGKVTDKMTYVGIAKNGESEVSTVEYINGRKLMVNVREDGIFELTQDGKVLFVYLDGKNKDESLNDWAKPELESEQGLLKIWVSTDYHDPSQDRLIPDQQTTHIVGVLPGSKELIDNDPRLKQIFRPTDPAIIEFFVQNGFINKNSNNSSIEDPLKNIDNMVTEFFKLLGSGDELPKSMRIKLPNGAETTFNPQLGIILLINGVPGRDYGWLDSPTNLDSMPSEPYTVQNDRLVINIVSNYGANSWSANLYTPRALSYILWKNDIVGDEELTKAAKDKKGIPTFKEIIRYIIQPININGDLYLIPNIIFAQSNDIGDQISYDILKNR